MFRSVRIHEFGDADVLQIEDVEVPAPASGEVRLRVRAIGLNRSEITFRTGRSPAKPSFPIGLGTEAAGVIEALGPDVAGVSVGDRVAVIPAYGGDRYAVYGEVALAPARSLAPIPDHASFVEAAATWMAYGASWGGLVVVGGLERGQTVLIRAASSSVGLAAIEVANRLGARPVALTRTSAKADELRRLGASEVIATTHQDIVAEVKALTGGNGAQFVFDPVGGPDFANLARATASGGTLILYGALDLRPTIIPPFEIFGRDLTVRGVALPALTRDDARIAALRQFVGEGLADGAFHPTIARTFPFDQIADAHRFIEAGGQVGKVVVTL